MIRLLIPLLVTATLPLLAQQPPAHDLPAGPLTCSYVVEATTLETDDDGFIPVDVAMTISYPRGTWTVLEIPHWTPGSYRLRDFPDRVVDLQVRGSDDTEVELVRLRRGAWGLRHPPVRSLWIDYRVLLKDNDRFMVRGPGRRSLTYEGPQMYLYAVGTKDAPCRVRFDLPDGWRAASGLIDRGDGTWFAPDYDFLADCPVKLGRFQDWTFETRGVPIRVVLDAEGGDVDFDDQGWLANIQRITEVQADIFGGLPFDHYTFLFSASRLGHGGGLEHLTSTAIGVRLGELRRGTRASLSTIAHEFFHLWNVKRARPVALGPFDYTRPVRTTMLWLCEGVTSYYTSVTLARAGLRTPESFWNGMGGRIAAFESSAARPHVSSAEASWTVWDERPRDRRLNYYTSGQVLGLLLDVRIRELSGNRHSLDDLMRNLYQQCVTTGRGYQDGDVERHLRFLTGHDFTPWFDAHVRGTRRPDYAGILAAAGLVYRAERHRTATIRGLRPLRGPDGRRWFWAPPGGDGATALRRGGELLALGGTTIDADTDVGALVQELEPETTVELQLRTPAGVEQRREVEVGTRTRLGVDLSPDPDASPAAVAIREGIVGGGPQ